MNSKFGILPLALMLSGTPALSDTALPDTTLQIAMEVANVTCQLNDGMGLSQRVSMPLVSVTDLEAGRGKTAEAPLKISCTESREQPEKITLNIQPAAGSSLIHDGRDGMLKTNKEGVGLLLTWKHNGQPVSLNGADIPFLPVMAENGIWDLGIVAKTIPVTYETLTGGVYTGAVILSLRYS